MDVGDLIFVLPIFAVVVAAGVAYCFYLHTRILPKQVASGAHRVAITALILGMWLILSAALLVLLTPDGFGRMRHPRADELIGDGAMMLAVFSVLAFGVAFVAFLAGFTSGARKH